MTILVTGASGNVGREVVRALSERSIPRRAPTRRGQPAFDFEDECTWDAILEGIDRLFLLRPPPIADTKGTLNPFLDRAWAAGVEHVVFLSVAGADTNRWVPHHSVERHLIESNQSWTILRPGFFAQNLVDAYRRDILEDDRLYVPAGQGAVAFVDLHDIGDLAADIFEAPAPHRRRAYTLTGPEALTFDEVARILTAALGRPIGYEPASVLGYARHLHRRGLPVAQVAVQCVLHVGLRFGQAATVDPTLRELLGRPPRTVADMVRDHASVWTP